MKTVFSTSKKIQRLGAVAFAAAFVLAPLGIATQPAQAEPSVNEQIQRYRERNRDNRSPNDNDWNRRRRDRDNRPEWRNDRDGRWDRDGRRGNRDGRWNDRDGRWNDRNGRWDNGGGRWDNGRNSRQNFSGYAVTDNRGNSFTMRTDSGRTITVYAQQGGQARRVDRGDRVTVAGYYRGGSFIADDLNVYRGYRR